MPEIDSWIWELILAVKRLACRVTVRAMRRKLKATSTATGAKLTRSRVRGGLTRMSQTKKKTRMTPSLARSVTRVMM